MPDSDGTLTAAEIDSVRAWIDAGGRGQLMRGLRPCCALMSRCVRRRARAEPLRGARRVSGAAPATSIARAEAGGSAMAPAMARGRCRWKKLALRSRLVRRRDRRARSRSVSMPGRLLSRPFVIPDRTSARPSSPRPTSISAVDLLKDRLQIYISEHVAPGGASAREAIALYIFDRAGFYVKGGKFYLPLRSPASGRRRGDAARRPVSRSRRPTSEPRRECDDGRWSTALSITNGTSGGAEGDNGKQYSWTGARVFSLGRIGLSASTNDLPAGAHRTVGGCVRNVSRSGPVVVLTEADRIHDRDATNPGAPRRRGAPRDRRTRPRRADAARFRRC